MPLIEFDKDLPKSLDTTNKQVKWVKKLALEHLGSACKRLDRAPFQGMFSRTFFLALVNGDEVALQFRTERLDLEAFRVARAALGAVVPESTALESEELQGQGAWAYAFTRMPGQMWLRGIEGKGDKGRIAICKSLGRIFSRGCLAASSEGAVGRLRLHLEAIAASTAEKVLPFRDEARRFLGRLDDLANLPLWVTHYDLNEVNVLIDEHCEVTALVDWELSTPRPSHLLAHSGSDPP
ncbi:hypothetical protein PT974_11032 [Cladobotryum mycophilum]|uniref:Aminoglycoside phosphotransferase domain-containing protein n=1 Tax=Cladobotryum mycophilum TaxID=491253 RepID=A0ABR0SC16_9HYPO